MVAPHNVGGPVLTAANLHLAACTTNFKIQEHFNDFADAAIKKVAPGAARGRRRLLRAARRRPASASSWTSSACAEFPRQRANFNLFAEDWHLRDPDRRAE